MGSTEHVVTENTAPAPRAQVAADLGSTALQEADGLPAVPRLSDVERLIGVPAGQVSQGRVRSQIGLSVDRVAELARPRCAFRFLPVIQAGGRELVLGAGISLRSRKLSMALHDSSRAVVFAVTIAKPIDFEIRRLSEAGKHFDAHVLDAAASAAVESLADVFQDGLEAQLRPNHRSTTLRFSPGYCDWEITQQGVVFSLLEQQPAGIELLPPCLMTPRKSITGVFGLCTVSADPSATRHQANPCAACNLQERCRVRRF